MQPLAESEAPEAGIDGAAAVRALVGEVQEGSASFREAGALLSLPALIQAVNAALAGCPREVAAVREL